MNREELLQIKVATWLEANLHEDVIFFHVPNEIKAKPQYHAKRKRMGVKTGVPDIVIHAVGADHVDFGEQVIYIELKAPETYKISDKTGKRIIDIRGGVLSPSQLEFQAKCKRLHHSYYVCDNLENVKEVLEQEFIKLKGDR